MGNSHPKKQKYERAYVRFVDLNHPLGQFFDRQEERRNSPALQELP